MKILTEPKNSLVKQYTKLFKLDDIDLEFEKEAIVAIARKSLRLKTGARGLRSVLENIMLGCMYDAPSLGDVESVCITRQCVEENNQPQIKTSGKLKQLIRSERIDAPTFLL